MGGGGGGGCGVVFLAVVLVNSGNYGFDGGVYASTGGTVWKNCRVKCILMI